ncbi:MAG TPA: UbiA family prenyltransferase [Cytophagaceae bacterium]|jgi:4-hydroxybenzoate polyprenyltransferase
MTNNNYSNSRENNSPILTRLYIYQKERFPILGHGLLVASFSFSAISYSRICRGVEGFVSWDRFFLGVFTTITLFLLVRIFDEFKDASEDAMYRQELPVPRGLVSLKELAGVGFITVLFQIAINIYFFPAMLILYAVVIAYLLLMGKEFFVASWLKKHPFWYVTSHMFIIPLVDIYASGIDWLLEDADAPKGLMFFFAVSYMNGIVLEVGRKLRAKEKEKEGVLTYTSMLGKRRALLLWIGILLVTLFLAIAASAFAGYGTAAFYILGVVWLICSIPAFLFLYRENEKLGKMIEYASILWTISMYLTLGGIPMIIKLIE